MTYEQENEQYKRELEKIKEEHSLLQSYFEENADLLKFQLDLYSKNRFKLYGIRRLDPKFIRMYELSGRITELENKLKQSKWQRRKEKANEVINGAIPQHYSGRLYTVNEKSCSTFLLWFIIIDLIICGVVLLLLHINHKI